MRRTIVILTMAAIMVAMMATPGTLASAQQSPCPPTGPSGGPATLIEPDEALGAGFICLDEEALEFFCPPEFELQLFPNPDPDAPYIAECVELSPSDDSGGNGTGGDDGSGTEPTQEEGEQQVEASEVGQYVEVS